MITRRNRRTRLYQPLKWHGHNACVKPSQHQDLGWWHCALPCTLASGWQWSGSCLLFIRRLVYQVPPWVDSLPLLRRSTWAATWPRGVCCNEDCIPVSCWAWGSWPWPWARSWLSRNGQPQALGCVTWGSCCFRRGVVWCRELCFLWRCVWHPMSAMCPPPWAGCSKDRPRGNLQGLRPLLGWLRKWGDGNGPGRPPACAVSAVGSCPF